MDQYISNNTVQLLFKTGLLILVLVCSYILFRYFYTLVWKKISRTKSSFDDYLLKMFRAPVLLLVYSVILNISVYTIYRDIEILPALLKIRNLLIIFILAWISVRMINAGAFYIQSRYDLGLSNNLRARKSLTQVKVFKAIAVTIIVIVATGAALMTFEHARKIGISVLTSAGIIGIIVGFAAQKSISMILAGIQLAITQPVRLDDLVIVEGEFGRIEEIQLTYVVVQIWDERRMVLPVTWFLEKPFQNLTRTTSSTTGTIFIFVDYAFPVDYLREALPDMLKNDRNWDGRTATVQVTDTTERYKEIRILLSSEDSSKNWNLRTSVREKIIDFINVKYPDAFSGIRIKA
ncbi:MAG TPA: mechanosensitive ion channel domain-containing protein [Bacteroidales bacterium]|nr:mechanosensitive ion channel domain-containing protein [Bacteroidales bacterium]